MLQSLVSYNQLSTLNIHSSCNGNDFQLFECGVTSTIEYYGTLGTVSTDLYNAFDSLASPGGRGEQSLEYLVEHYQKNYFDLVAEATSELQKLMTKVAEGGYVTGALRIGSSAPIGGC